MNVIYCIEENAIHIEISFPLITMELVNVTPPCCDNVISLPNP